MALEYFFHYSLQLVSFTFEVITTKLSHLMSSCFWHVLAKNVAFELFDYN